MIRVEYQAAVPDWVRRTIDAFIISIVPRAEGLLVLGKIDLSREPDGSGLSLRVDGTFNGEHRELCLEDREIADPRYQEADWDKRRRELVRGAVLDLLGLKLPWGILTGVRPSKLYRHLQQAGFSPEEIATKLQEVYRLSPEKAALLQEIDSVQAPFMRAEPDGIGVYVGIPFCPTRCRYCSFPAYPLGTHGHLVAGFLRGLAEEIRFFAEFCRNNGLRVQTVYVGGGTPTSLVPGDFGRLLMALRAFSTEDDMEFTVEAGRPETVTPEHLQACLDWGVNRISVNPQTLHDRTLQRIGRCHTSADIFAAVARVREARIAVLNMDLIAGSPGETTRDLDETLDQILTLAPENLTIHTLAPKRAAQWDEEQFQEGMADPELADWLEQAGQRIRQAGWRPYYLYRQRRIMANQENIGYAVPGRESLYNIWMMEETKTVLGLGGGAITKWVDQRTGSVERWSNPKCPATYGQRISASLPEKAKWLRAHLN